MKVSVMDLGPYHDLSELFEKEGPVVGSLLYEEALSIARPAIKWYIDNLDEPAVLEARDAETTATWEGKHQAAEDAVDLLLGLHAIEREHYVHQLAKVLETSPDVLRRALNESVAARQKKRQ